jgi:hypothetical protein
MITIVWIYVYMIRLFAILASRRDWFKDQVGIHLTFIREYNNGESYIMLRILNSALNSWFRT